MNASLSLLFQMIYSRKTHLIQGTPADCQPQGGPLSLWAQGVSYMHQDMLGEVIWPEPSVGLLSSSPGRVGPSANELLCFSQG